MLDKNDKLVMTGDSITDCGRGRPAGEGLFDPMPVLALLMSYRGYGNYGKCPD